MNTAENGAACGAAEIVNSVLAAPVARACALSGLSRAGIYRLAAAGKIVLRKSGRTTLVDMASVRAHLASLPTLPAKAA